jgi:hypothetical protein
LDGELLSCPLVSGNKVADGIGELANIRLHSLEIGVVNGLLAGHRAIFCGQMSYNGLAQLGGHLEDFVFDVVCSNRSIRLAKRPSAVQKFRI